MTAVPLKWFVSILIAVLLCLSVLAPDLFEEVQLMTLQVWYYCPLWYYLNF